MFKAVVYREAAAKLNAKSLNLMFTVVVVLSPMIAAASFSESPLLVHVARAAFHT